MGSLLYLLVLFYFNFKACLAMLGMHTCSVTKIHQNEKCIGLPEKHVRHPPILFAEICLYLPPMVLLRLGSTIHVSVMT